MIAVLLLAFALALAAPAAGPTPTRRDAARPESAFYASTATAGSIADKCVARVAERLYSGGKLMCEDPFELVYPLEQLPKP